MRTLSLIPRAHPSPCGTQTRLSHVLVKSPAHPCCPSAAERVMRLIENQESWLDQPGTRPFSGRLSVQGVLWHQNVVAGYEKCLALIEFFNYWSGCGRDVYSPCSLSSLLSSSSEKTLSQTKSFVMSRCLLWHLEMQVFPIYLFGIRSRSPGLCWFCADFCSET